jgi:tetratricopeptide (TPR) repeat protein
LQRLSYQGATIVSLKSLAAPSKARRAYEKAQKELQKKKVNYPKVTKELEKAIKRYPEYAEAWYLIGQTRLSQDDPEGAREAFQAAINVDDRYITPYLRLTWLEISERRFEAAAQLTRRLMELSPHKAQVLYLDGLVNYYLGRAEDAENSFRSLAAQGHAKSYPLAYLYLGAIDLRRGEIARAAKEFRLYLRTAPESEVPLKRKERLVRQLVLWEEQGLIQKEAVETQSSARSQQQNETVGTANTPR